MTDKEILDKYINLKDSCLNEQKRKQVMEMLYEYKDWCRFLILLVESCRKVIISGTVHWFWLKTSFHPLLWTSSGLTGS